MDQAFGIGIDFGSTNIKAALLDKRGRPYASGKIKNNGASGYRQCVEDLAGLIRQLSADGGIPLDRIRGVGIACPGMVDVHNGKILWHPGYGWRDVSLSDDLEALTGIPVKLLNDGNAAVLGETKQGAAKNRKNVLMITLGTGVGGGILVDGHILNGSLGIAGEVGHFPLENQNGAQCCCGLQGCLESYCATRGLLSYSAQLLESGEYPPRPAYSNVRQICSDAREGDPLALRVLQRLYDYLSQGLAGMIHLFNPEVILLSGGIANMGDMLLVPLRRQVEEKIMHPLFRCEIRLAELGEDAGLLGAYYYLFE